MSSIFLHVGQCGNQLSLPLWNGFIKSQSENSPQVFTALDHHHRSIHIDSEPKVIASLPRNFKIRKKNLIVGRRGRGSNFALGYNGIKSFGDDKVLENVIDSSRLEIEKCDSYSGAIVCHSLSGGTGSGLGCRVIETLRDEYPTKHVMSCAVMPYQSGESPLQTYNALLALHWLQNYTDAVILLQNDALTSHMKNFQESTMKVSFQDINNLAANQLCGVFLPTDTLCTSKGISLNQEPWELVRTLTPMPSNKFISLSQHASSKMSWDDLVGRTLQRHTKHSFDGSRTSCISATVIARGDSHSSGSFLPCLKRGLDKKIKRSLNTVDWNPYPLDCWTACGNSIGPKSGSSLTLATNSSCILDPFTTVLWRARAKLNSRAYLHWYARHGFLDDVFNESLETLETVIGSYKDATAG